MTPDQIRELERLEKAATPPPWDTSFARDEDGGVPLLYKGVDALHYRVCNMTSNFPAGTEHGDQEITDANLIAAARNALPSLLRQRTALSAACEAALEYLEALNARKIGGVKMIRTLDQLRAAIATAKGTPDAS
jgi:hypothetical protein